MASKAVSVHKDNESVLAVLQDALKSLDRAEGEVVVDFSSVHRVDPAVLSTIEELVNKTEQKKLKLVLRGVDVDVYKVLKLVRLTPRLTFTH